MATNEKPKTDNKDLCRLVTPEFRVSYPHVFKAQSPNETDKPKFSITMLFPKDKGLIGLSPDGEPRGIAEVLRNAKIAEFGPKESWPKGIQSPVKDGDHPNFKDKPGYAGHYFIKASSTADRRPAVIGPKLDEFGKFVVLTEPAEFYPGCYARANIFARVWKHKMSGCGVQFILDGVQKIRDGKPFSARKPLEQIFSPIESPEELVDETDADF